MNRRLWYGPFILLLIQISPLDVRPDSTGHLRISFGFGAGQVEDRSLNCAGEVVDAVPLGYRTMGAAIDFRPTSHFRMSGFGGLLDLPEGDFNGPFGGVVLAHEGQNFGIGGGPFFLSGPESFIGPSMYWRLGKIDGTHFRFDVGNPSPVFGTTGIARIGIGFNQRRQHGVTGMVGFGVGLHSDESHIGGPFLELMIPVATDLDLSLKGSWRPSHQYVDGGLALGLRYTIR